MWEGDLAQGSCPFSSLPRGTQPSLFSNDSVCFKMPSLCCSPGWAAANKVLCAGPLRGHQVFRNLCHSLGHTVLTDFQSQMFCGLFFPALVIQNGEPGRVKNPCFLAEPLQLNYLFGFSAKAHGCRASPFPVSVLPTSLNVAFL